MNSEILNAIPGGKALLTRFGGHVPSFHDAEVLSLAFDRIGPTCVARVHAFEMTSAVNSEGFYVLKSHTVVTFRMSEVSAMELDGFNHQNALMGLTIIRKPDDGLRVELDPAYGISGFVECRSLSISTEPGIPRGSVYEPQDEVFYSPQHELKGPLTP